MHLHTHGKEEEEKEKNIMKKRRKYKRRMRKEEEEYLGVSEDTFCGEPEIKERKI